VGLATAPATRSDKACAVRGHAVNKSCVGGLGDGFSMKSEELSSTPAPGIPSSTLKVVASFPVILSVVVERLRCGECSGKVENGPLDLEHETRPR
jgi:hypothetical protein